MKVLIGTPIHQTKDYVMQQWLKNVAMLDYPADLFMVGNTPGGPQYAKQVKGYCEKFGIKNCKIKYVDMPPEMEYHERVSRCQEVIRQEALKGGYDAWFCWECDQIIPTNALDELVHLMQAGDFEMVVHNCWFREIPYRPCFDLGVALVSRKALENHSFVLDFGADPEMPENWGSSGHWLKNRIVRRGGSYSEVLGVIKPIYHISLAAVSVAAFTQAF